MMTNGGGGAMEPARDQSESEPPRTEEGGAPPTGGTVPPERKSLLHRTVAATQLYAQQTQRTLAQTGFFAGVSFDETKNRVKYRSDGGCLAGAVARVETAGDLHRRITATRLVLTGVFALALTKKRDTRELYLTVEGEGYAFAVAVKPSKGKEARAFAAKLNAAAGRRAARDAAVRRRTTATRPPQTSDEDAPGSALPDQLARLADLHSEGHLDDAEFAAAKRRLLETD